MPKTLAGIWIQDSIKAAITYNRPYQAVTLFSSRRYAIYPLGLRSLLIECASLNRVLPSKGPWSKRQ
jgi:hypothetical protein